MNLVYSTVGCDLNYLQCFDIFLKTFKKFNNNDVLLICDENMEEKAVQMFNDNEITPLIHIMPNSDKPHTASMNKLHIFSFKDINKYDNILYVDLDCIFTNSINSILNNNLDSNKLYAYKEKHDIDDHRHLFWSLNNYTDKDIQRFRDNNMYPFNAGCFLFKNTPTMKQHFDNIIDLVKNYNGEFFYEQSFMNYYFNTNLLTDYSIITDENYYMNFRDRRGNNNPIIIHFCGGPGNGLSKIHRMRNYMNKYI